MFVSCQKADDISAISAKKWVIVDRDFKLGGIAIPSYPFIGDTLDFLDNGIVFIYSKAGGARLESQWEIPDYEPNKMNLYNYTRNALGYYSFYYKLKSRNQLELNSDENIYTLNQIN